MPNMYFMIKVSGFETFFFMLYRFMDDQNFDT